MRSSTRTHLADERGAVLIHVGLALTVLLGLTAFVIDYGVILVSRAQAQNAADAGALAGAVSLAYDITDPATKATNNSRTVVGVHRVWGDAPGVAVQTPYNGSPCADAPASCVRVDVFRNGANGSTALPAFFSTLFNANPAGTRAMAVAWAGAGNASECLKPWGVADKWQENNPTPGGAWTPTSTFDPTGPNPDVYTAADANSPGTGFTLAADLGTQIRLKPGRPGDAINPGWFMALDLTGGGGSTYRDHISGCAGVTYGIGDEIPKENGNMVGPTGQGTNDLIDLDPDAEWDPIEKKVINSCVGPPYTCSVPGYARSPRIVAIPIFNLDYYLGTEGPGNGTIKIVNILGFFVDRVENPQNTVFGYLAATPALKRAGRGEITPEASFAKVVQLVR